MNITPISPLSLTPSTPAADTSEISKASRSFSSLLTSTIKEVEKQQSEGEMAINKLNSGQAKNLHEVMIAVEEADISMRMLVQMRNKAIQAYEEIMRMQI